jgi:cell division control protein 6
LYRLTRIGEQQRTDTKCAVAALSNNPSFMDKLDGRAESSFNPTDIEFSDYDSGELSDILQSRRDAFADGALDEAVIPLCSAFGAQNHGDARKAIELLRRAGKIAENKGSERVLEEHVEQAESDVDKDRTKTLIKGLASQKKYCLYAIAASIKYSDDGTTVSEVANNVYRWITDDLNANEVTGQTYRKYVKKLETCQLISVRREGQGRGNGIRAEYELNFPEDAVINALEEGNSRLDLPQDELESVVVGQHKQIQS